MGTCLNIKFYFLATVAICFLHPITSKHCSKQWMKCGDSFCCCKDKSALCESQHLSYIPKLPSFINFLKFTGNNINTLSAETFANITVSAIEYLNLLSNGIENIHPDTFEKFTKLEKLSLQNNNRLSWQQLQLSFFNITKKIRKLYLDGTGLANLTDDIFDGLRGKGVVALALRNNNVKVFNEKPFYHLQKLKSLDFRNNSISAIRTSNGSRLGHKTIEFLGFAYNEFEYWPPTFCKVNNTYKTLYPNLLSLDLTGDAIMELKRDAWSCLQRLKKLILAENVVQTLRNDIFLDLISLENLQVSFMAKPFKLIEPRAFNNKNLKELHFDNNNICFGLKAKITYDKMFTFCPNVTKLLIGYNDVRGIYQSKLVSMLSPLKRLTDLYLNGVHLHRLPKRLFYKFENLTKLYLGDNKLTFIDPNAFDNVTNLKVLYLDGNKIKVIDDTFPITLRKSLKELNLADNPFSCSFCSIPNNIWFRYWIDSSKILLKGWPKRYKCVSPPDKQGTLLLDYMPKEADCEINDKMIVAYVTIGVFLAVFTCFSIAGYKGRWYIRFWTIKLQRKWFKGTNVDPERQRLLGDEFVYDAYVIYHDNDRGFIRKELLPFMETKHNYKLFIWDRDAEAGDQTVVIVVDNIYKSSHVIAVISKGFLKDQWCDFQLAVSLDRQIELRRNFLTLLILEDIDKKLLSKAWCVLFTKTTTAEWCERKNDIRRKLMENQIFTNVPCMLADHIPRQQGASINDDNYN